MIRVLLGLGRCWGMVGGRTLLPPLWIDESPMNLCEILGLQPKGVNALSFSSR